MCCFSIGTPVGLLARLFARPIHVTRTNIFGRMVAPGIQALGYSMNLNARRPVAMVLPLPVVPGSGEDAVTFVDLSNHPRMFSELAALFEIGAPQAASRSKGGFSRSPAPRLVVHKVGAFIASYVPTRADFTRLDPKFRLPEVLFDAVPHYADYGFAVFQLVPGKVTIQPMAMRFPTRAPAQLFFPTVHVHDGRFHPTAAFDHTLYYQTPRRTELGTTAPLSAFGDDAVGWLKPSKAYEQLVVPEQVMLRRTLHARLPNEDIWIEA